MGLLASWVGDQRPCASPVTPHGGGATPGWAVWGTAAAAPRSIHGPRHPSWHPRLCYQRLVRQQSGCVGAQQDAVEVVAARARARTRVNVTAAGRTTVRAGSKVATVEATSLCVAARGPRRRGGAATGGDGDGGDRWRRPGTLSAHEGRLFLKATVHAGSGDAPAAAGSHVIVTAAGRNACAEVPRAAAAAAATGTAVKVLCLLLVQGVQSENAQVRERPARVANKCRSLAQTAWSWLLQSLLAGMTGSAALDGELHTERGCGCVVGVGREGGNNNGAWQQWGASGDEHAQVSHSKTAGGQCSCDSHGTSTAQRRTSPRGCKVMKSGSKSVTDRGKSASPGESAAPNASQLQ